MALHKDIICFNHCGKTVFVYDSASVCPLCREMLSWSYDSSPLTIPYPFVKAFQHPCSVVLRPSIGDFLSSFHNLSNLHIGVTSSNGTIYEFDVDGLIRTLPKNVQGGTWNQCILIFQATQPWYDRWDDVLAEVAENSAWRKENYKDDSNNCYTFILNFLKHLGHYEFSHHCHDKLEFSEAFIVSKTQNAAKYITVHRKLASNSYWVEE